MWTWWIHSSSTQKRNNSKHDEASRHQRKQLCHAEIWDLHWRQWKTQFYICLLCMGWWTSTAKITCGKIVWEIDFHQPYQGSWTASLIYSSNPPQSCYPNNKLEEYWGNVQNLHAFGKLHQNVHQRRAAEIIIVSNSRRKQYYPFVAKVIRISWSYSV